VIPLSRRHAARRRASQFQCRCSVGAARPRRASVLAVAVASCGRASPSLLQTGRRCCSVAVPPSPSLVTVCVAVRYFTGLAVLRRFSSSSFYDVGRPSSASSFTVVCLRVAVHRRPASASAFTSSPSASVACVAVHRRRARASHSPMTSSSPL